MRILLVEDDRPIAETLRDFLSQYFLVDCAYDAASALEQFGPNIYDLVILDCLLPDARGIELLEELRERDSRIAVLVLTGNSELDNKVSLLNAGADDYVTKPFHAQELLARIRALLRRGKLELLPGNVLEFSDLQMDLMARAVRQSGQAISLRRKEFDLLEYLLRNQRWVVTRDMLLSHVWGSPDSGTKNTVDVHIKNLRGKIDKPFDHALIHTVPGVGYKLDT